VTAPRRNAPERRKVRPWPLRIEPDEALLRARTRGCMAASIGAHVVLFVALALAPHAARSAPALTEITLLDPGELDGAPAPAAAEPAIETAAGAIATASAEAHFARSQARADVAPTPQSATASDDRLDARLAAMRNTNLAPAAGTVPSAPQSMWGATPAHIAGPGSGGGAPLRLTHGAGSGSGPPLALARGTEPGAAPALAPAPAPTHDAASVAPARASDSEARRTLADATLLGPIADRAILARVTPAYPEWAKREAVEGSVTLTFTVRPDGSVKENVLITKTAGFEDFDENARSAIRSWRFAALTEGRTGEQWGSITFRYRLRDGG
jgi:TonB family protein